MYNATYSPMLNPIEFFFGYVKKKFRKLQVKNENELVIGIANIIKNISE